ncbi:MAG TPA: carboxypeptidase-like regulatory domain-containing protein [Vicinamibacterales bacterium]|nr:carboxypeptidase-like regulatory domain-containing protein [Vicinamibacterales bacterium]
MIAQLAIALLLSQSTSFQGSQAPPRDVVTQKGTSSVKGKVVAADTGRAVRRVQVSIASPDLTESRSMSTTAQGLFEFKDLPAGRYTITASLPIAAEAARDAVRRSRPGDGRHRADLSGGSTEVG